MNLPYNAEYTESPDLVDDNAPEVASEAYFCKLQAGNYEIIRKMTLLK